MTGGFTGSRHEPAGVVHPGRFEVVDEIAGGKINGISIEDVVRTHIETFYRTVDAQLEQKVAEHLRSKGWSVIEPALTVDDRPVAREEELERHMEKQDVSWSDAWNYFAEHGYNVDHLEYTR